MDDVPFLLDKPLGATPLEAVERLRSLRALGGDVKLSYAGRLDPMATGLLVVLHGDLLRRQEDFWHLPKEYDATVVLGCSTDSYDVLGLPVAHPESAVSPASILTALQGLVGKPYLSVPVFSSVREQGKPLFAWAREGLPTTVSVPVRQAVIQQIDTLDIASINRDALIGSVHERVQLVRGDFRQESVLDAWTAVAGSLAPELPVVRFRLACGSGTYVRSLAHELGRRLRTGAVLTALRRTRVGAWRVTDAQVLQLPWP